MKYVKEHIDKYMTIEINILVFYSLDECMRHAYK